MLANHKTLHRAVPRSEHDMNVQRSKLLKSYTRNQVFYDMMERCQPQLQSG